MIRKLLLTIPVLLFFSTSCVNHSLNVFIDPTIEQSKSSTIIVGKTNLPDGAELRAYINYANSNKMDGYYAYPIIVKNGQFKSEPFEKNNSYTKIVSPIAPGEYELKIIMNYPTYFPPESVEKIIGKDGKNLVGNLVINSMSRPMVGWSRNVKYISYKKTITIH